MNGPRPPRPPPEGARLVTRSGEPQRSRLLGMCRSPARPTVRRRLTAAAVVDGSYESRRVQQVLVTRTSTKATAVLVIALACVFGAPAVANSGIVPPPLKNQSPAQPNATLNVIVLGQQGGGTDAVRDRVKSACGTIQTTCAVRNGVVADL